MSYQTDSASAPSRRYKPRLMFYHPSPKGTGSAAQFEVKPASGDRDGAVFLTLAAQKSAASAKPESGQRAFATFDWQAALTVKLNFTDLSQILMVFNGALPALSDGKGLFHDSAGSSTIIRLAKAEEPLKGFSLEISRKQKGGDATAARVHILLNPVESYGLRLVLSQILPLVAFGIPMEPDASANPAGLVREDD
jgi:hypothetical protein